ncbi:MAG TPA: YcxB family protein [Candidatus Merdivicinus excrementipullorum]|uniref:YcxB family protein n=1 Tax=Candidatus Merdivicinus excrementipullorum TaxID=2840867 RepID=A0A9D1FQ17_9FIRM|nr:YcxB family protein [Candidatus Merdivicinus excrementipullorum]
MSELEKDLPENSSEETLPEEMPAAAPEKPAQEEALPDLDPAVTLPDEEPPEEEAEEKEKKIVPGQGVNADKYDVSEPWLDGKRVDDSVEGLGIDYDLKGEEVETALKYFQKKTIYRKNAIFTVILAVIAALYGQAIFKNPDYAMGYFMIVLALAVIFMLWFLPARHIKSAANAADISEDSFHLEFCPGGLLLPQEDGRYLVGFDRPALRAVEFPSLFLIVASKEKLFVLPKRCIPEENQEALRDLLREGLGARFEKAEEK